MYIGLSSAIGRCFHRAYYSQLCIGYTKLSSIFCRVATLNCSLDSFLSASILAAKRAAYHLSPLESVPFLPFYFKVICFISLTASLVYPVFSLLSIREIANFTAETFTNTFLDICDIIDMLGC